MRQRALWFLNGVTVILTAIILLLYLAYLPTNITSNQSIIPGPATP